MKNTNYNEALKYLVSMYSESEYKPFKASEFTRDFHISANVTTVLKNHGYIDFYKGLMRLNPKIKSLTGEMLAVIQNEYMKESYQKQPQKPINIQQPEKPIQSHSSVIEVLEVIEKNASKKLANEIYEVIKKYL